MLGIVSSAKNPIMGFQEIPFLYEKDLRSSSLNSQSDLNISQFYEVSIPLHHHTIIQ